MSRRYYLAPATGSVHAAENVEGVHDAVIGSTFIPCVVIDPEDREQVERLWRAWTTLAPEHRLAQDNMHAALREFANPKPPKPAEPTGLGAVVEDAEGERYVRRDDSCPPVWVHATGGSLPRSWKSLDAVRVLSEGVSA